MTMKPFYIVSLDDAVVPRPTLCRPVRFLRWNGRSDLLLVHIEPPLFGRPLGYPRGSVSSIVLASRESIGGLRRPLSAGHAVHVLVPKRRIGSESSLPENALHAVSWSEIFPTLELAEEANRRIPCEVIPTLYPFLLDYLEQRTKLSWDFLIFGFERHWCYADVFTQFCGSPASRIPANEVASFQTMFLKAQGKADAFGILRIARCILEKFDMTESRCPEQEYSSKWMYLIMNWVLNLDRTPDVRLALADEIAEEFGWPEALSSFTRKEGFSPDDEGRRMTAWQSWLDGERAKWKPKAVAI